MQNQDEWKTVSSEMLLAQNDSEKVIDCHYHHSEGSPLLHAPTIVNENLGMQPDAWNKCNCFLQQVTLAKSQQDTSI